MSKRFIFILDLCLLSLAINHGSVDKPNTRDQKTLCCKYVILCSIVEVNSRSSICCVYLCYVGKVHVIEDTVIL